MKPVPVVYCILAVIAGLALPVTAAAPRPAWVDYFGASAGDLSGGFEWNSYLDAHHHRIPWARTLRGIGRTETGTGTIDDLEKRAKTLLLANDLIIPVGGLRHAKSQEEVDTFFTMLVQDGGKQWREVVYQQAVRLARLPGSRDRIVWQIGNEANIKHWSRTLRRWAAAQNMPGARGDASRNDHYLIPFYVEYFLAPTVAALRRASLDVFGAEHHIRIMPTPVAFAYDPETVAWLEALLTYSIRGDYAKSLAGKRVHDLVDIIAIHYLLSRGDENWQTTLDTLHRRWVGTGRIRGIWATEEIGKDFGHKGKGASTALKVVARNLHWLHSRAATTPQQSRSLMWGWRMGAPGTRGEDALVTLHEHLGNTPLTEIGNGLDTLPRKPGMEYYLFQSANDPARRVAMIFTTKSAATAQIEHITMKADQWAGQVKATAWVFSSAGQQTQTAAAERTKDGYSIKLNPKTTLAQQAVLVLLLTHAPQ
jgi:hypothetical protein